MATLPGLKTTYYILELDKPYRDSLPNPYAFNNDSKRSETVEIIARQFGIPSELNANNVSSFDSDITRGVNAWLDVRYTPGDLGIYGQAQGTPGRYTGNVVAIIRSL
jgi:hypothetical protein